MVSQKDNTIIDADVGLLDTTSLPSDKVTYDVVIGEVGRSVTSTGGDHGTDRLLWDDHHGFPRSIGRWADCVPPVARS